MCPPTPFSFMLISFKIFSLGKISDKTVETSISNPCIPIPQISILIKKFNTTLASSLSIFYFYFLQKWHHTTHVTWQPAFYLLYLKNYFFSARLPPPFNSYVVFHCALSSSFTQSFHLLSHSLFLDMKAVCKNVCHLINYCNECPCT